MSNSIKALVVLVCFSLSSCRTSTGILPNLYRDTGISRGTLISKPSKLKGQGDTEKEAKRPDITLDLASGVDSLIKVGEIAVNLDTGQLLAKNIIIDKRPSANQKNITEGISTAGEADAQAIREQSALYGNIAGQIVAGALGAYGLNQQTERHISDNDTKVELKSLENQLQSLFAEHGVSQDPEDQAPEDQESGEIQLTEEQKIDLLRKILLNNKNKKE